MTIPINPIIAFVALLGYLLFLLKLMRQEKTNLPKPPDCHVPINKTYGGQVLTCPYGCKNYPEKCPLEQGD